MIKLTPEIEETTVTPSTSDQTIEVTPGIDGYGPINVEAVTSEIDSNIQPENIKRGVTILGTSGTYEAEAIQVDTLPTASATEEGNIYQYIGATDANYTNGYFYKCISDGQNPATYSWSNIQVQASSGGLPSQTGNAGKFLTTDGTDASWGTVPIHTEFDSISIGQSFEDFGTPQHAYNIRIVPSTGSWTRYDQGNYNINLGSFAQIESNNITNCVILGARAGTTFLSDGTTYSNKLWFANANSWYEVVSPDGTIPEARLASTGGTSAGDVLQLDSNGNAIWAPVSGGGSSLPDMTGQSGKYLTNDGSAASWATINALSNTATGNSSLTIDGTAATDWGCVNIGTGSTAKGGDANTAIGVNAKVLGSNNYSYYNTAIGQGAKAGDSSKSNCWYNSAIGANAEASAGSQMGSTAIGANALASEPLSIAISGGGSQVKARAIGAIQIGGSGYGNENTEAGTLKIGLGTTTNGVGWTNYKLLDTDGTIPEDRLASTTGTSTGDVLQLDSNGNAVWAPASGGGSSLPDMTGQSGKFLTTDGTAASWATVSGGGQTIQVDTLPTASSSNVGTIYQYIGNSGTYKKGYFYISSKNEAVGTATVTKSSSSITSVSVTASTFLQKALQYPQHDHSGANVFVYDEMEWCWLLQPENIRVSAESFPGETNNLAAWGITVSPEYAMPANGDTITVNYTTGTITYAWNESPTTSFSNSALAAHSLTLQEATPTSSNYCMNIGYGASINTNSNYSIAMGTNCRIESNCRNSIAIGAQAEVQCVNTSGRSGEAVAIGSNIQVDGTGVAIGTNVYTANGGIVLGCEKYNYDPLSPYEDTYFRLAFGATHAYNVLNGKTGLILPDRIAATSGLADGNYRPRLVVSNGVGTIEWVAE